MITIINLRNNGGHVCSPMTHGVYPEKALESLVVYELGYGGDVIDIDPTKITVVTKIMSCVDTTIFEGTEEEMKVLVEAAVISLHTDISSDMAPEGYREKILEKVMATTKGIPLLVSIGSGMIVGHSTTKMTLLAMLGEKAMSNFDKLQKQNLADLCAFVGMVRIDKIDFDEAIQALV